MTSASPDIKLRTSLVLARPIRNAIILLALGFMAAMASVDTATAMVQRFPSAQASLFVLPAFMIGCCFVVWAILYDDESSNYLDIGIVQLALAAAILLGTSMAFSRFAHSNSGVFVAPGWSHANRLFELQVAADEIKEGGGSLEAPLNRPIAQALRSKNYGAVLAAHTKYEQKEIQGKKFSRWMMAHRLYPIYDKARIAKLQATGWVDKETLEEVNAHAMKMSPPAGSTLIQQQAWAVLAGEADPMTKLGEVLESKE